MLVDIPAAQHKTMFFIVSLNVHVFINNYRAPSASTTALPRLCVSHHKETCFLLKPVTTVTKMRRQGETRKKLSALVSVLC